MSLVCLKRNGKSPRPGCCWELGWSYCVSLLCCVLLFFLFEAGLTRTFQPFPSAVRQIQGAASVRTHVRPAVVRPAGGLW